MPPSIAERRKTPLDVAVCFFSDIHGTIARFTIPRPCADVRPPRNAHAVRVAEGDDDLRKLPLHLRKASLERLLARRPEGVFINPFERGEIGPDLFRAACQMGLEGLVSKRRDRPYHAGRSKHWIKVKNRKHPAMSRVMEAFG